MTGEEACSVLKTRSQSQFEAKRKKKIPRMEEAVAGRRRAPTCQVAVGRQAQTASWEALLEIEAGLDLPNVFEKVQIDRGLELGHVASHKEHCAIIVVTSRNQES